jgi:hypothetical protein
MKKLFLILAFLGLVQVSMAAEHPEQILDKKHIVLKDSVVIEFGKAGRIVILVQSTEDFEKLKLMNINQIISELGVKENKETGEVTLVEIHKKDGSVKEVVRVNENGLETEVRLGRLSVLVDESGLDTKVKIETDSKEKKDPPFKTNFTLDLGVNNFLQKGKLPTSDQPYATKGWGSWNVGLNWMGSQRLSDSWRWNFGLAFQWYNFKFENRDFQAVRGQDQISFVERTDVTGIKSKLSASYLTAMTLLEVNLGKNKGKGLTLAAGPYIGYRLGGRSKFVYEESGRSLDQTEKINTGLYLENLRYGFRGELGIGKNITFFSTYDLNELFQEGKGPALNPITFGIKLLND